MKKIYFQLIVFLGLGFGAQAQVNLVQQNFTGVIVPQYMASGTSSRLPVCYYATVSGLDPNTVYSYMNQLSATSDFATVNPGAGNPLLVIGTNWIYTTQPRVNRVGASGTFTTDNSGNYTGWFANINTGNSRFVAGATIFPTITINGGGTDTSIAYRYALNQSITVLSFGASGANSGTGIYGLSQGAAQKFVALYSDEAASGRPLAITYTESENIDVASSASWYVNNVNATAGAWGTILPNALASGVRNITLLDNVTGALLANNTSDDGSWGNANTVNPTGGSTPIAIGAAAAPLNAITGTLPTTPGILPITVTPNPTAGWTAIRAVGRWQILAATGRVVYSGSGTARVDLSFLPAGVYVVRGNGSARLVKL
jgi:hypothetical protein